MPFYAANRRRPSMAMVHRQYPPNVDRAQLRRHMAPAQKTVLSDMNRQNKKPVVVPQRRVAKPSVKQPQPASMTARPLLVPAAPKLYLDPVKPETWGPVIWSTMHVIAAAYPVSNATDDDKDTYRMFYETIAQVLPCVTCRAHFNEILAAYPLTDNHLVSRQSLAQWVIEVRNRVSAAIGSKKVVRYSDLSKFVNMHADIHHVTEPVAEPVAAPIAASVAAPVAAPIVAPVVTAQKQKLNFAAARSMVAKHNSRSPASNVASAANLAAAKQVFSQMPKSTVLSKAPTTKKAGCGCAAKRKAAMAARNRYG